MDSGKHDPTFEAMDLFLSSKHTNPMSSACTFNAAPPPHHFKVSWIAALATLIKPLEFIVEEYYVAPGKKS
jgi:hypothetical protein